MQSTRQAILEYLKKNGQATVDELAHVLKLTAVTVRHHLDILRGEQLITEPVIRRRTSRGRPQYVFALTDKASAHFDKNYDDLAAKVLEEVKATAGSSLVNVIFQGVAARLSAEAPACVPGAPFSERLDQIVKFLNQRGYMAHWERADDDYYLHTCNCPYEALVAQHPELCAMDLVLVGNLLGAIPQRVSRIMEGQPSCAYRLRPLEAEAAQ